MYSVKGSWGIAASPAEGGGEFNARAVESDTGEGKHDLLDVLQSPAKGTGKPRNLGPMCDCQTILGGGGSWRFHFFYSLRLGNDSRQ